MLLKNLATIFNYSFYIKNAVWEGLGILTDIIHNVHLINREQLDITRSNNILEKSEFLFFLVKLIKIFYSFNFPTVLVLEELQLIDSLSL